MDSKKLKLLLGSKIKAQRTKLNLTQERFSEIIGISQRQISLIELGKSFPKPETISKISKVFNCSISELFDFSLSMDKTAVKKALFDAIENLSEEKLKILYIISRNI